MDPCSLDHILNSSLCVSFLQQPTHIRGLSLREDLAPVACHVSQTAYVPSMASGHYLCFTANRCFQPCCFSGKTTQRIISNRSRNRFPSPSLYCQRTLTLYAPKFPATQSWVMLGQTRFELVTPSLSEKCSNRLSYWPKKGVRERDRVRP